MESLIYVNVCTYQGSLTITWKMACSIIQYILINPNFKDVLAHLLLNFAIFALFVLSRGARGDTIGWMRYKPEGRGFDSRQNRSGRTMALGSTQPLTEMSTRNISWEQRRLVRRADNLTTFLAQLSANLGALASWNPHGRFTWCNI